MITDLHTFNMSEKCVYLQWTVKHILLTGPLKKSVWHNCAYCLQRH